MAWLSSIAVDSAWQPLFGRSDAVMRRIRIAYSSRTPRRYTIRMNAQEQAPAPQRTGRAGNVSGPTNGFTVDVEPWFCAHNLNVLQSDWDTLPLRIDQPIEELLTLLDRFDTTATFFVLGWLAERRPAIVEAIQSAGHEIASHGFGHEPLTRLTVGDFIDDVRRSRQVLEDVTGGAIAGYRAPGYSIGPKTLWALDALEGLGFAYDSSVYPLRAPHGRYGLPGAPRHPYRIRPGMWEFPLPIWRALGRSIPACTGGYLRHWPMTVTQWAMRQNEHAGIPVIVNVHPWELDPEQPRVGASWFKRRLHYGGLHKTHDRLTRLLAAHRFGPLKDLMHQAESRPVLDARLPSTPETIDAPTTVQSPA